METKEKLIRVGKFPLELISQGKEACRKGWRDRLGGFDMLSVVSNMEEGNSQLLLKRSYKVEQIDTWYNKDGVAVKEDKKPDEYVEYEDYSDITDMLADDWYIIEEKEDV